MNQVILASHGNLSVGALDTVHMIVGEIPNVHALTLQREDKESISGKIVELIKTFDKNDHVYVLTDMLGSSVNNSAVELLQQQENIVVIAGMNMPLILSLALEGEDLTQEQVHQLILESRKGIVDCGHPEFEEAVIAATQQQPVQGKGGKSKVVLARLDYRLLHGQVVFSWINTVGANRIIIVDNDAATNDIKQNALKLAKPTGVYLNIFTVEKALSKMAKLDTLGDSVMFVFGNTKELLEFSKQHQFDEVNYGATANVDGAEQIGGSGSSVFLTEEGKKDTQELLDLGTKVYVQQTPTHQRVNLNSL